MSYTNVPSEILSEIIDLLLQISCKFEFKNGRYVIRKGAALELIKLAGLGDVGEIGSDDVAEIIKEQKKAAIWADIVG